MSCIQGDKICAEKNTCIKKSTQLIMGGVQKMQHVVYTVYGICIYERSYHSEQRNLSIERTEALFLQAGIAHPHYKPNKTMSAGSTL